MVLGLDSEARSRLDTWFVTAIFVGGSLGSAAATIDWAFCAWPMVCLVAWSRHGSQSASLFLPASLPAGFLKTDKMPRAQIREAL
jgi:hypothetical protein